MTLKITNRNQMVHITNEKSALSKSTVCDDACLKRIGTGHHLVVCRGDIEKLPVGDTFECDGRLRSSLVETVIVVLQVATPKYIFCCFGGRSAEIRQLLEFKLLNNLPIRLHLDGRLPHMILPVVSRSVKAVLPLLAAAVEATLSTLALELLALDTSAYIYSGMQRTTAGQFLHSTIYL